MSKKNKPKTKVSNVRKLVELIKAACDFVLAWLDYWKED